MVTLSCGILPSLDQFLREGRIPVELPRDYIKYAVGMLRNAGRLASGIAVGIVPECRSVSQRNRGRHRPEYAFKKGQPIDEPD